ILANIGSPATRPGIPPLRGWTHGEAITIHPRPGNWRAGRLVELWARLITTWRGARSRAALGAAAETLISRSTGGRC
ncbi:MAG: hypothetical protein LC792_25415, partial [Actinobacteria bacterium]|nr:hypothetical protein [Actinomycetota bacterium]